MKICHSLGLSTVSPVSLSIILRHRFFHPRTKLLDLYLPLRLNHHKFCFFENCTSLSFKVVYIR